MSGRRGQQRDCQILKKVRGSTAVNIQCSGWQCMYLESSTLFMWGFWEPVARDWGAYDLKRNPILVFCEKWQNLVELKEGARPAVNEHERQNLLILTMWRPYVDEMHIQPWYKAKRNRSKVSHVWTDSQPRSRSVSMWANVYLLFWFWSVDTCWALPPDFSSQTHVSSRKRLSSDKWNWSHSGSRNLLKDQCIVFCQCAHEGPVQ